MNYATLSTRTGKYAIYQLEEGEVKQEW